MLVFRKFKIVNVKRGSLLANLNSVRKRYYASGNEGKKDEEGDKSLSCEWDWSACKTQVTCTDCKDDMCAVDPCIKQPCVIIVGGGIAGLSVAARLTQCGLTNFKVLEATDRPGGRIKSCWLGDSVVELGSQTINGSCIANKVFTLAAQEQLIKYPLERIQYHCGVFLTPNGRAISQSIVSKALDIYYSILSRASDLSIYGETSAQEDLRGFFDDAIETSMKDIEEESKCDVAKVLFGLTNYLKTKLGADLKCVSAESYGCQRDLPGGDVRVRSGMAGVIAPLLKPLPKCGITYCKPVASIRWGTASSVCPRALVVTEDGEEFPADYVVVTVSLGVLKIMSDCLFCPALPARKMDAVNSLGFGHVNKLFLKYEKPFWPIDGGGIDLAWSAEELNKRQHWTSGISSFNPISGSHSVLQVNVGGSEAKTFEMSTDQEVASSVTALLREFTGDPVIPEPIEIVRSCWSTDPHFYGAYTFMKLGSTCDHLQAMAEPLPDNCFPGDVPPIILFAGEHTSPKNFATAHGARESGVREGERIIRLTKKLGGPPNSEPACEICTPAAK